MIRPTVVTSRVSTSAPFKRKCFMSTVPFGKVKSPSPPTPIDGIYAAVTRRTLDDTRPDGWVPEQKITVEEALVAYTMGGAFASFEESQKGVISPGMLADLTMIDKDLRAMPAAEIRTAKVVQKRSHPYLPKENAVEPPK